MLIVGLLIGWGGAKFSEWRRQGRPGSRRVHRGVEDTPDGGGARGSVRQERAAQRLTQATGRASGTRRPVTAVPVTGTGVPVTATSCGSRAAKARSGTLTVQSTPPGAAVTINGKWSGRTPLTRATPFGDYAVRVPLPGYQTRQEQVSLSADSTSAHAVRAIAA